ncbi:hypothetical protein [Blastococcus sp. SYSU DS0541]
MGLALHRAVDDYAAAEGVEHAAERDALVTRGVRYGQGHLFGRPRPAAEVLQSLPA